MCKTHFNMIQIRKGASALPVGLVAIASLSASGCGSTTFANPSAAHAAAQTAPLTRGTLVTTISAAGTIQAESEVKLGFQAAGNVSEVRVKVGDVVKKGDVIARLDTSELELALSQAQASRVQAQNDAMNAIQQVIVATANYSRTVASARPAEIDAARASYAAALEGYNKIKSGAVAEDIAAVAADLRNAEAAVERAQFAYDNAFRRDPAGIGASPEGLQLEQATNTYAAAKAGYDKVVKGADKAQLASAARDVQATRAELDKARQPALAHDIEQAQAQLEQARLQVKNAAVQERLAELQTQKAQLRLSQSVLTTPIHGVIAAVTIHAGESVGNQPVVTIVDTSQYHMDVTVDEIDVANLRLGQTVAVTLDALPESRLNGTVERIAPTAGNTNGTVFFPVRVVLAVTDATLRAGMTANASIVLARRDDALLAPLWAVKKDTQSGKTFLAVRRGERVEEVEVQTGLRGEESIEIVTGAQAGELAVAMPATFMN